MENWSSLVAPATAVVGLVAAAAGVALTVAQTRKAWKEGSRLRPPPDFRALAPQPSAPAVPSAAVRKPRSVWAFAALVLAGIALAAVGLRFAVWPPPAESARPPGVAVREVAPLPREVSAPVPSEVVLTAGPFSVSVPTMFDKAAQGRSCPVSGAAEGAGWLVALSRKVGSADWHAQSVLAVGPGIKHISWNDWSRLIGSEAEVCLLAVEELPIGLSSIHSGERGFGTVSESVLHELSAARAQRSGPQVVRVASE